MIRKTSMLAIALVCFVGSIDHALVVAQEVPRERFQSAVALFEEKRIPEAREAFGSLLADFDTPENRAKIEFDPLLAGSLYYLGETYFQEDRFEDAATRYTEVIAAFRTFRPESYYHLGLSKHYRQDYAGAIATFEELVARYPGSALSPQALYYQGVFNELLKDKVAAKAAFQMLIERYPKHSWAQKAAQKIFVMGGWQ